MRSPHLARMQLLRKYTNIHARVATCSGQHAEAAAGPGTAWISPTPASPFFFALLACGAARCCISRRMLLYDHHQLTPHRG